jgi:hypothetical protein
MVKAKRSDSNDSGEALADASEVAFFQKALSIRLCSRIPTTSNLFKEYSSNSGWKNI